MFISQKANLWIELFESKVPWDVTETELYLVESE